MTIYASNIIMLSTIFTTEERDLFEELSKGYIIIIKSNLDM